MPLRFLAAAFALGIAGSSAAAELVVMSAGAVKEPFGEAAERWEKQTGTAVKAWFGPMGEVRKRLAAGETADLVVAPAEALRQLEMDGIVVPGTSHGLGAVDISASVRKGAPMPDISTPETLRRTLLAAKSVAYMDPSLGTSGRHFDQVVLAKLGIADAVRAKAKLGKGGSVGDKVASGEAEIAFQNTTELLGVDGTIVVGPIPEELQLRSVYTGAVMTSAKNPAAARALLDYLVSIEGRRPFLEHGFTAP